MCAPRWPLILWGLLGLLRPHLCAEKCHFLVNDISDDGHLYVDGVKDTISFRLSDSCAGDVDPVWVKLATYYDMYLYCKYRRDGEQYRVAYKSKRCGYDAGTGVFTATTGDVIIHIVVHLLANGSSGPFEKEVPLTVKEPPDITKFTVQINGAVITAEDSNIFWVEENSSVTLGCEWSPGKPPQTAVLKKNQTALHPVNSSVLPPEDAGETAKRVEHTIVRFGGHDSGVYTCQLGVTKQTMLKHLQLREPSQITNFTVEINGAVITAEDSNTLWVEENSTVTLGCEWSPGKPPQTAVLKRDQTALHPVKSSVLPREEVGELAKRVEHTIPKFWWNDNGIYTCQLEGAEQQMSGNLQLRGPPWFNTSNHLTFKSSAEGRVALQFHVLTHSTDIKTCWIERIPAGDLPFTDNQCDRDKIDGTLPNCRLHATFYGTSTKPSGNFRLYLDTGAGQGHVTFSVIESPDDPKDETSLFLVLGGLGVVVFLVIMVGAVLGVFIKRKVGSGLRRERGYPGMGDRRLSTYAALYGVTRQNRSHELSAETEDPNRAHLASAEVEDNYNDIDDACVEFALQRERERGDPGMGDQRSDHVTRLNRSHESSAETEDPNRSDASSAETEDPNRSDASSAETEDPNGSHESSAETEDNCNEMDNDVCGTSGDPESRPPSNDASLPPPCRGRRRMQAEEKRPPLMKTDAPCTVHTQAAGTALPSNNLHPTVHTQAAGTALPSDNLHPTVHTQAAGMSLPSDNLHPTVDTQAAGTALPSDNLHPTVDTHAAGTALPSDYLHPTFDTQAAGTALPSDNLHPTVDTQAAGTALPSDYLHPTFD